MRDRYDFIVEQSKRQEPTRAVGFPIVLCTEREAAEDLLRVTKIDAVLAEICQSLRPMRTYIVATFSSYSNPGRVPSPRLS